MSFVAASFQSLHEQVAARRNEREQESVFAALLACKPKLEEEKATICEPEPVQQEVAAAPIGPVLFADRLQRAARAIRPRLYLVPRASAERTGVALFPGE